jgi:hypothetical protein
MKARPIKKIMADAFPSAWCLMINPFRSVSLGGFLPLILSMVYPNVTIYKAESRLCQAIFIRLDGDISRKVGPFLFTAKYLPTTPEFQSTHSLEIESFRRRFKYQTKDLPPEKEAEAP